MSRWRVLQELAERPLDRAVEDDPQWQHINALFRVLPRVPAFNNAFRQQAKAVGFASVGAWRRRYRNVIAVLVGLTKARFFRSAPRMPNSRG